MWNLAVSTTTISNSNKTDALLRKMAAKGYFPFIYDKTKSQEMWSFLNRRQMESLQTHSRRQSGSGTGFVDRRAKPPAVYEASKLLKEPEYRPLEVFCTAGEDGGSAALSEADQICELCIKLKEFELCEMMKDEPKIPPTNLQAGQAEAEETKD